MNNDYAPMTDAHDAIAGEPTEAARPEPPAITLIAGDADLACVDDACLPAALSAGIPEETHP